MPVPPTISTSEAWAALQWAEVPPRDTSGYARPFQKTSIPAVAGLYRLSWVSGDGLQTVRHFPVAAKPGIDDAVVVLDGLRPPLVLSIGRTTDLRNRMEQHFGNNHNNNRLLKRLRLLLPAKTDAEIKEVVRTCCQLEVAEVSCWMERCRLERYGCAVEMPIFDFEAEH